MKILIVPNNTDNNCFGLRNALPAKFLEKRGHEIRVQQELKGYYHRELKKEVLDPEPFDWCDVVVFNRHYNLDTPTIKNLMRFAKENGKRIIYETDDLLEAVNLENPAYQVVNEHASQVKFMALYSHLITTTTPYLSNELSKYNKVKVLPNCIDPTQWKKRKGGNKKVRIGWAGGSSHAADLLLITDIIKGLQNELDFEFIIFGLIDSPWDSYIKGLKKKHEENKKKYAGRAEAPWYTTTVKLDKEFSGLKWEHHPFVPLKDFNQKLSDLNLDIGLCPLVDSRFNRCKSAIKFYEYAMVDTVTMASKVSPYKEEVNYCAKPQKWRAKLKRLIEDKILREDTLKEQRDWVLKNRDINKNIHLWEEAYN